MIQQSPTIPPTDAELLMRFCGGGDDAAFRLLVERHAGLVMTVCRRVLANRQDVEDAFQATFLVLARRADSIRSRDCIGSWLFKVAHRTAIRAARDTHNRSECQLTDETEIPSPTLAHLQERETFELLAAELNLLPENYRAALILFYLEGKSRQATADELDVSEAALKARLARGRQLLRRRLMRRGVALSLAMAAVTATSEAALTAGLVENTVTAGLSYAATGTVSAACSAHTVSLAKGFSPMLSTTLTKPILTAAVLLTAGLLVAVGVGTHSSFADAKANGNSGKTSSARPVISTAIASDPVEKSAAATTLVADSGDGAAGESGGQVSGATDGGIRGAIAGQGGASGAANPRLAVDPPLDLSDRSEAAARIEEALTDTTEVEFVDTPLKDAIDFLADLHEITILLEETALSEEDIASDEPITQVLSGISLGSVLHIMLKPLGLTYLIEDEVMKITTVAAEAKRKETRVYSVNSLTDAGYEMDALQQIVERQGEGKVDALQDVLVVTASQHAHRKTMQLLEQLQRAVELQGRQ